MGEVIHLEKRPSQAVDRFPPIVSQREIDHASATELRAALVRKLRWRFAAVAAICYFIGWPFLASYFLVFALFTRDIVSWVKGPPHV